MYTSSGCFDVASEYLDKSLSLIQSVGQQDKKLQASVYQNLGAVHNQLRQFVKAVSYHEKAIELYGKPDFTLYVPVMSQSYLFNFDDSYFHKKSYALGL